LHDVDINFGAHGGAGEPAKEKKIMLNVSKMANQLNVQLSPALL
jgi:hypothetical protein